jgi:ubiquinone/menaquinone biosynthesis C-methylase UbiE
MLLSKIEIVDPSMPLRRRVAERIVRHFKSQSSSGVPKCLHVRCAGGNDLELIYSIMGDSSVELYGVDFMEVPLQMAKRELPMATFQPADIEQSLPFEDNTFHCILASRLLVHVVDLP